MLPRIILSAYNIENAIMNQPKNIQSAIFSVRLGELLRKEGLTQKELAAATGIAQSTISHYVRGTRVTPRVEEVLALSTHFRVTIEWLLGADPAPGAKPDPLREELDRRDAELRTITASLEEQIAKLQAMTSAPKRTRRKHGT